MAVDQTFVLKDSGDRREFETGAVRDMSEGKGRYDLIPYNPLRRLAIIYEKGAQKYGVDNWKKGIPLSSFVDSGIRHLQKAAAGLVDEDHAAQAVWNIFAFMWTLEAIADGRVPASYDDRQDKIPEDTARTITVPMYTQQCDHAFSEENRYTDTCGVHITEYCHKCGCYRSRLSHL